MATDYFSVHVFSLKTAELQKDVFEMQQKVKRYKEHIYELESELEQRAATIATCEEKVLNASSLLTLAFAVILGIHIRGFQWCVI